MPITINELGIRSIPRNGSYKPQLGIRVVFVRLPKKTHLPARQWSQILPAHKRPVQGDRVTTPACAISI